MKRGIVVLTLMFFIIPFVNSQALTIEDMFNSRGLSYSSDKVLVPADSIFQVQGENVPAEISTSPASAFYYVGTNLVATSSFDGVEYYYLDRIGSDIASKELPFGEPLTINNLFSFTGKEYDEDLYYFSARYYDPQLGRFTSTDPVEENHPYIYVNNNPLVLIDPDGREERRYTWTAPTTGSAVEFYLGEGQFNQGPFTPLGAFDGEEAVFTIPDPLLATGFGFRVAGVDSLDRQGPWSETSDEYFGSSVTGVADEFDFATYGPLPPSFPNPASDRSNIRYYVPRGDARDMRLQIYDIRGALIREIETESNNPGYHEYKWDLRDQRGRDVASGVYIIRYAFTYHFEGSIEKDGEEISKHLFRRMELRQKMTVVK